MTTRPGYIWSGTEWVSIGQEAVVAPVSYQTSAPSTPSTGDIWIDSNDDVPGIDTSQFLRWRKTAVGGETSVSGTDDNGLTLQYTANYEQVYLNGVLLVRGQDYTATNGTSITGLTALAANDVVEVFGVVARVVGDVYTQAQSDDKYSPKTTTGLVLITSATIGSAVTSIEVTNAFSATYDAYKITISGGAGSTEEALRMQLGTSTTGYYAGIGTVNYSGATTSNASDDNATLWRRVGRFTTNLITMNIDVLNPFLSKPTLYFGQYTAPNGGASSGFASGFHNVSASYTSFTISPASGTLTGGTIKVYGYK